jgi:hypothetical protein
MCLKAINPLAYSICSCIARKEMASPHGMGGRECRREAVASRGWLGIGRRRCLLLVAWDRPTQAKETHCGAATRHATAKALAHRSESV